MIAFDSSIFQRWASNMIRDAVRETRQRQEILRRSLYYVQQYPCFCVSEGCMCLLTYLRYLGSPGDFPWECVFSPIWLELDISSVACAFRTSQNELNLILIT